jgi:uncharacterized protein (TIGR03083 family)
MPGSSPWPLIHEERAALAADLESLDDSAWSTPSLCRGWTVLDMLGHLAATAKMTPPKFFVKMARAGFRFNDMTAAESRRETAAGPAQTLATFRSLQTATSKPPGPAEAMLGEAIIHPEDIRRPLGITRKYPAEAVLRVADFYRGSNLIVGAKNRIAGLSLTATDADWRHGSGPEVSGPVLSLVLAMTGRSAALDDLDGEGLGTLRSRFPQ